MDSENRHEIDASGKFEARYLAFLETISSPDDRFGSGRRGPA
jgi:hypothetical protein